MDNKALKSIYKPRSGRDSFATIDNCKVHDNSRYAFVETVPSDGGQYDIIKGYDTQADRPVCIKILQGSYAEGYLNSILSEDISANIPLEATALAKLRHPNIVRVLDWCFVDDRSGVVTEWLDGVSLEEYEFYNLEEVFSCLYQLADAVDYMHSQGVYNRDIHAKNVNVREHYCYS